MQLLHEHKTLIGNVGDLSMNQNMPINVSSDRFDVKEKRSSDASLRAMNPVASGDNVTTGLNSTHKIKEEAPPLVPCCEGRELQINEDLVRSGLSAISVKHDEVVQCLSLSHACDRMQPPAGLIKHRNSFRSLHRPDLKRVPYLRRMTPDELEMLFRGYADVPNIAFKCVHREGQLVLPPDENVRPKDPIEQVAVSPEEGAVSLHPIPETRSGAEDVPAGMRLHGARARLYTSVLAGARAGDQLDNAIPATEELDSRVVEDVVPEDEVQLTEELQIILPPRCDDITAESSVTASNNSSIAHTTY